MSNEYNQILERDRHKNALQRIVNLTGIRLAQYPGKGSDVCAICGRKIDHPGTLVGCGTGPGTDVDGHFAHVDCYDVWQDARELSR